MATVRYAVEGVPPGWADAFMPTPTLSPAGRFSVRWQISAAWGTDPVPSPPPRVGTLSGNPAWRPPSSVAPDYILPDIAVVDIRSDGGGGANLGRIRWMPARVAQPGIPNLPINYPPSPIAMRGRKVGGRHAMHWPRVVPRWPPLRSER